MTDEIVLVDDDPITAELLRRMLRRHPWTLRDFGDPLDALDYLSTNSAYLLIVDTRMPAMDGPELLVHLAERDRLDRARTLLCSAGPVLETCWTRRLPTDIERIDKNDLFDRAALAERLDAIETPGAADSAPYDATAPDATAPDATAP